MSAAAKAASAEPAAPAAAAEAAASAAGRRLRPVLGAYAAGTGPSVMAHGVPQTVIQHVPGAEAAGIAVAGTAADQEDHHNEDQEERHQRHDLTAVIVILIIVVIVAVVIVVVAAAVVIGEIVGAVLLIQRGGPAVIGGRDGHGVAVAQIAGGHHKAAVRDGCIAAGAAGLAEIAGQPRRIVPRQGHLARLGLVEPAGGVIVAHRAAVQRVHVLLHPRIGKGEGLAVVIGPVQIDVHIAVVKLQPLDVVAQGGFLPEGAVGHADLQLLSVGQLLQRRPRQRYGDGQAAVLGIGGDGHVIAVDIVVIRPRRHRQAQGQHKAQRKGKQLFHSPASFPFS